MTAEEEFDTLRPELTRAIRARYRNRWDWDLDDVLAEGYIGALLALRSTDDPRRMGVAWTGAMRRIYRYVKREWQYRAQLAPVPFWEVDDLQDEEIRALLERVEARAVASEVLAGATERQRLYLRLHYWESVPQTEIARRLSVTPDTVQMTLAWCLNKVRTAMGLPRRGRSYERQRELYPRTRKGPHQYRADLKERCPHGHEYTEATRYYLPNGTLACRICKAAAARRCRERAAERRDGAAAAG